MLWFFYLEAINKESSPFRTVRKSIREIYLTEGESDGSAYLKLRAVDTKDLLYGLIALAATVVLGLAFCSYPLFSIFFGIHEIEVPVYVSIVGWTLTVPGVFLLAGFVSSLEALEDSLTFKKKLLSSRLPLQYSDLPRDGGRCLKKDSSFQKNSEFLSRVLLKKSELNFDDETLDSVIDQKKEAFLKEATTILKEAKAYQDIVDEKDQKKISAYQKERDLKTKEELLLLLSKEKKEERE